MSFANDELRHLYDVAWANADQIAANPEAEPDDHTFQQDVQDLIRWRKGETDYPFPDALDSVGPGSPGFLDVGLPLTFIGNRYPVIDARQFVADTGGYRWRSPAQIRRLSVHHSVTREPVGKDDELALLTEIGNFHVYGRDWPGYAYHFTVAPSGRPYYTGDLATTRYIVGPDNPYNAGICLLGTFTDAPPTPAAQEALRLLIGEIQFTLGAALPYFGHRDTPAAEPTSCPGATWPDQWTGLTAPAGTAEPAGVQVWSEAEIVAALTAAAGERNVPAALLLGGTIAESGLDQFAERLGQWPDVSFGLGQQTVKWAPVGDGSASEENIALVRDYFSDPANAIPVLADKLATYYHHPENPGTTEHERIMSALAKYNSNQWEIPESHRANEANYRRALEQAAAMLGG